MNCHLTAAGRPRANADRPKRGELGMAQASASEWQRETNMIEQVASNMFQMPTTCKNIQCSKSKH